MFGKWKKRNRWKIHIGIDVRVDESVEDPE